MRKKIFFLFTLIYFPFIIQAQFYNTGQDPASIRWKQINTENFKIIYPDFFEPQAQQIANIYHSLYMNANTLQHTPRKISVVVHAKGGVSNGMVAWAPKRIELYTVPTQEANEEWLEHLCTHEFRHVVQLDKVNQNTTHALSYLWGEQIVIGVGGLYLPKWFMEGDAVAFESSVGKIGRGRSPEFINEAKAMLLEKGIYSFEKTALGSVRDYVPNHYNMGYFTTSGARMLYGDSIWHRVAENVARKPYLITPFKTKLKQIQKSHRDDIWGDSAFRTTFANPDGVKQTNSHRNAKRMLFNDIYTNLRQQWLNTYPQGSTFDSLPVHTPVFANYYYPTQTPYGLVAYKAGLRENGAFVRLSADGEKRIVRTGSMNDEKFAYAHGKLYWAEYRPNVRWEQGGRQVIVSYDLDKRRHRRHRSTYNRFAPFAMDKGIGVVEVDDNQNAYIVLLDSNMHEIKRIAAQPHELFVHPTYRDGEILVAVQTPQGNRVERINAADGARTPLIHTAWYEIDNPQFTPDGILFRASYDGNNALYRLADSTLSKAVSAPFGVRFPSVAGDSLLFAYYTSDGYRPASIALNALDTAHVAYNTFPLAENLAQQEGKFRFDNDSTFHSKRYGGIGSLFNFHSWGFGYVDATNATITSGIVAHSQNKLNTFNLTTGYIEDSDYDNGSFLFKASYEGLRPKFSITYQLGNYTGHLNNLSNHDDTLVIKSKWLYSHAVSMVSLPFNLSRRNYNRHIIPYIGYEWQGYHRPQALNVYSRKASGYLNINDFQINLPCISYHIMKYGLQLNNLKSVTQQELYPSFGQTLYGGYGHAPFGGSDVGDTWWMAGQFYFPGLTANHSLQGYVGYQDFATDFSGHSRQILNPRGFSLPKCNQTTIRTSYYLPLAFPDFRIGSVLYIKKLYGGVFFDTGSFKYSQKDFTYHSYGVELHSNLHVFQHGTSLNIGIRGGYEDYNKKYFSGFTFNINY